MKSFFGDIVLDEKTSFQKHRQLIFFFFLFFFFSFFLFFFSCTICPEERFPERYIGDSFKGTSSGGGETSFLEVMRQRNLRRKMKMKKTLNRKSTRQKGTLKKVKN